MDDALAKRIEEATAELLGQFGLCPTKNDGEAGQAAAAAAVAVEPAQASGTTASSAIARPRQKARPSSPPGSKPANETKPGPGANKRDSAGVSKILSQG